MALRIPIGLLSSTSGTYGAIGREVHDGALMAIEEANALGEGPELVPVAADPGGTLALYLSHAEAMLREQGCRHIVGTITSASRKEVIPTIEKHDALLWYACPYEGFETNENVIYTNACPNQHLVPLFEHLIPTFGRRVYLVGSNYIWGWEVNRLARMLIHAAGGEVLGERYLPFDAVDMRRIIADIEVKAPDFVLNNFVGETSYAFIRAYAELGQRNAAFRPERRPLASCNFTECEFPLVGREALAGHMSALIYVAALESAENRAFRQRVAARFGEGRTPSAFFVGAYVAGSMLAEAIRLAGGDDIEAVRRIVHERRFDTPLGRIAVDPRTNHAATPSCLGRITPEGDFDLLGRSDGPITADPYLADFDIAAFAARVGSGERRARPGLRVVP